MWSRDGRFLCRQRAWRNFQGGSYIASWHWTFRRHEFASARLIRWDRKWNCVFWGAPQHSASICKPYNDWRQHNRLPRNFLLQAIHGRWNRVKVFPGSFSVFALFIKLVIIISFQATEPWSSIKILRANFFLSFRNAALCEERLKLEANFNRASANVETVNAWVCCAECSVCQEKTRFVLHIYRPPDFASLRCWRVS